MQKILIAQVQFIGGKTPPWTQAWIDKLLANTRAFFLENSNGKMDIEWTLAPWITAPVAAPWSLWKELNALGILPQNFYRYGYITPGVPGYGKGYASGPAFWILGGIGYANFSLPHEIGHTLGCDHAESLQIGETEYVGLTKTLRFPPLAYTTGGSFNGTGDPCDVMSYSGRLAHFAADEKMRMGWMAPVNYDGTDRTYALTAMSVRGGACYAVRVPMSIFSTGPNVPRSTRDYWIEYRVKSGWDAGISIGNEGVQIRVVGNFNCYTPAAIDATMRTAIYGSPSNPLSDIAFKIGDSFTDDTILIDVVSCNPTEAQIRVRPVPPPPVYAPGTEFIIDNLLAGMSGPSGDGSVAFSGVWKTQAVQQMRAHAPNPALRAGKSTIPAEYTFTSNPLPAGQYEAYVWWPSQLQASSSECKAVPVTVSGHSAPDVTKTFDQRFDGGAWRLHGVYDFAEGARGVVSVTNGTDVAVADAVRFLRVGALPLVVDPPPPLPLPPPPPPPPPPLTNNNAVIIGQLSGAIGGMAVSLQALVNLLSLLRAGTVTQMQITGLMMAYEAQISTYTAQLALAKQLEVDVLQGVRLT